MKTIYTLLIICSLYIAIIGLLLLIVRASMKSLKCNQSHIYKLWQIFLFGFGLLFLLTIFNHNTELKIGIIQIIQLQDVFATQPLDLDASWLNLVVIIWALISSSLLFTVTINYSRLKKYLLQNSINYKNTIETPFITTPAAFGAIKPRIYVPENFKKTFTQTQQQLLLEHEQTHCNRFDPLILITYKIINCLFWFHPLMHFLNKYMQRDQETSCDEIVLIKNHQAVEYSKLLLNLNIQNLQSSNSALMCSSTTMLKERIMLIKNLKTKGFTNSNISKIIIIVVSVGVIATTSVIANINQISDNQNVLSPTSSPPKPKNLPTPKAIIPKIKPISTPAPLYPRAAAISKIEGYVIIEFDIATDGTVNNLQVVESKPKDIFNEQALKSVESYIFEPVSEKIRAKQKVVFNLDSEIQQ